ncbi:MAG: hypothetical protein KGS61_08320 [Verrucomicrobia bacterium]|nr:hypothetical protein [Verrucomicrobiota bacterium]
MAKPFLQCHHRFKNGKDHCYWSIAEKVRTARGWAQRHLLYLGEINDSQQAAWTKVTEVFDTARQQSRELALYPADRDVPDHASQYGVQVRLTQVEAAFKDLKDDLSLRPIFHSLERRIEAHIFVSFLAYCLHVSLRAALKPLAPGLSPRSLLEKFAAIQMLNVHFPTTDGRELIFCRYTQPEKDHKMLLAQLGWELPPQSPPRITQKGQLLPE